MTGGRRRPAYPISLPMSLRHRRAKNHVVIHVDKENFVVVHVDKEMVCFLKEQMFSTILCGILELTSSVSPAYIQLFLRRRRSQLHFVENKIKWS